METTEARDTSKHGRRFSDDVRELAFQLWDMRCNQNAEKVSALLATDEFGHIEVTGRTIREWASDGQWEVEASKRFEQMFPGIHHRLFRGIVYAAAEGLDYWQDVNAGRVDEPNKVRMLAITSAFDRVGFSPVGKGTPAVQAPKEQMAQELESLTGLPPDELMRLEEAAKGRKG